MSVFSVSLAEGVDTVSLGLNEQLETTRESASVPATRREEKYFDTMVSFSAPVSSRYENHELHTKVSWLEGYDKIPGNSSGFCLPFPFSLPDCLTNSQWLALTESSPITVTG